MSQDFEKLGSFYLGREHDLANGETSDKPLLYKSKDLTTHAVCVGMTGSGKTGLCLSLLEEAALDGVPAIAIDPKGDLGNLLLAFPDLRPQDFRPWIDESEAARKGQSPDDYAAATAQLWRGGLAKWGQQPQRIQAYCDAVERVIYTPGSTAGIPLTVLKSFAAPPKELRDDADALRERIQSAASGVLALVGIDADPVQSREHIFLSTILNHSWREGQDLSVADLIRNIQKPPFDRVGIMDLETFYAASNRTDLAMKLNNLLASPSFAGWMQGQPLSINDLLYSSAGKPRLSILSIAHLNDAERMFFVTILLNELVAWMRTQPGTSSLRAILYMDEVFGYFPPVGEPPSKRPMLTLLKQARAFGVGCMLATQNPVDLDYKGLSNCGTWFLGRLQTERDKARVIEGLEGASAQAGAQFDKRTMEATLAALGSRVFLMNNVHQDTPAVFHTRWAMSYLGGPLTRDAIKRLMDPVREQFSPPKLPVAADEATTPAAHQAARPVLPGDVEEKFVAVDSVLPEGSKLSYQAGVLADARVHFVSSSHQVDCWRTYHALASVNERLRSDLWESALMLDDTPHVVDNAEPEASYGTVPSELAQKSTYKSLAKSFEEYLYRSQTLKKWYAASLTAYSELDESEGEFRQRIRMQAREARDAEIDRVEARYKKKLDAAELRVAKAQAYYDEQNTQFWGRVGGFLWSLLDLVLAVVSGGRSTRRRSSSTSAARQAATEHGQAQRAKLKLDAAVEALDELERERDDTIEQLREQFDPDRLELEEVRISPRKSDILVGRVLLAWLPYFEDSAGRRVPAY